jgi:DNA-binding winged helix-turn-helix (wHTH) protein/DNA-binding NarL/FixJ family response regulator
LIYEFGPFLLDVRERRLQRNGRAVALRGKAFDTLRVLVENHGRLVTKEVLMKAVWPDALVEEGNLANTIAIVRKALGNDAVPSDHVETVPGHGYRFVGRISAIRDSMESAGATSAPAAAPPPESHPDLAAGRQALDAGAWQEAKLAFERLLKVEETPEALEGLGLAAWWLDLADVVFDSRERAFRAYRTRGDRRSAARVAVWIAWDSAAFRGEEGVAKGWLQRARRLLEGQPESPEHAWLAARDAVFTLLDDGDPEAAEALAKEAIRVGQTLGAIDYEMVGRSLYGFSLITTGRVTEGLRELDEVSAAILAGELTDRVLIALAGCYLIGACDRARDHGRAVQWCERVKEHSRKWGLKPLFAVCRTQYASVCMWRGAWDEAERELTSACDELALCRPGMTTDGLARLGELRRRQGRLEEAASLFDRSGGHPIASLGRAAIALDRDDRQSALELAERHLRRLPAKNRTERAVALELLIRALAIPGDEGDLTRARAALDELHSIATAANTAPLLASASLAAGLVSLAQGNHEAARRELEDAVDLFERSGAPFEAAHARVSLASVLSHLGRANAGLAEVERAKRELTRLDARVELARADSIYRQLSARDADRAPSSREPRGLTTRELEVLRLISTGCSNQAIADRLCISEHTVHRHVANTLSKLDVPSRSAAVAEAAKLGLIWDHGQGTKAGPGTKN